MIKVHASGYIWTNLEFDYPVKDVTFEPRMHKVTVLKACSVFRGVQL